MENSGKKIICYTSRKSRILDKNVHSELPSTKKGLWRSYAKRCRRKHCTSLQRRNIRRILLGGKLMDTLQTVHAQSPVKGQKGLHSLLNKSSCINHKGKLKIAANEGEIKDPRRRRRKKKRIVESDEALRLQRRTRYLIIKMKLEQNLIDAYSGDGWKGQSREKIKPEKELQRAQMQILKCKLGIRDAIHQLDSLGSKGSITNSKMQPDGSVFHELILCGKCRSNEAFPDNDIIICNGTCNSGFHQKCLESYLERIPPGEQPWLCKFCDRKKQILEAVNAHLGTCFGVSNSWEDIFTEAVAYSDEGNAYPDPATEWPSDDSGDEDYDPVEKENSTSRSGNEEDITDNSSSSSSSLCCSSDEDLQEGSVKKHDVDLLGSLMLTDSYEVNDCDIISHCRRRTDVDYKKLHEEMFGKELADVEQHSEDEDWGPHRRKRRRMESDNGACMAGSTNDGECSNMVLKDKISNDKRSVFRIPSEALEKLRLAFAENELPSRTEKESLSNQLGIAHEKISKWFKNARYTARKMEKAGVKASTAEVEFKGSVVGLRNQHTEVASVDSSYLLPLSSFLEVPERLRKILRKRHLRSIASCKKQNKQHNCKAARNYSSVPVNQNSKHQGPLHFQVDEAANAEQLYLAEMERLYNLEDRLQNLKKALLSCTQNDNGSIETKSEERDVIYVPIAEVLDKS